MREMPFGRADVRHGLHDAIFGFETSTQRVGELSDLMKAIAQAFDPGLARAEKEIDPPPPLWRRFQQRAGSRIFSLLIAFFPARFEHLIVSCFLDAFNHEMLSNSFLFLECRDVACDGPWNWR